jgi:hypothetical protein
MDSEMNGETDHKMKSTTTMRLRWLLACTLCLTGLGCKPGATDEYQAGALHVKHPYARATVQNQANGAAYVSIENQGSTSDRLLGISTGAAQEAAVHSTTLQGNVMRMRPLDNLTLQPAQTLVMKPGEGAHIMLIGLKQPLQVGTQFPLTLRFEKAGPLTLMVNVENIQVEGAVKP